MGHSIKILKKKGENGMDEKGRKEWERKEEEQEKFRRTGGMVTRIEFYVSYLLLVALVLLRVGLNSQKLGLRMTLLENTVTHKIDALWDDVNREIAAIPGKVMQESESMFLQRM